MPIHTYLIKYKEERFETDNTHFMQRKDWFKYKGQTIKTLNSSYLSDDYLNEKLNEGLIQEKTKRTYTDITKLD